MIELLKRRVMGMVGRCVIEAVNDGAQLQAVQISVMQDELHDDVEHFSDYGFSSHPHAGAEGVVIFAGGVRSHGLVVAVGDRRYRLTGLAAGEVAVHDDQGQTVWLKRDRILVESPTKVEVIAPQVLVTADSVDLGAAGGPAIARVGDDVAGGKIVSGSSKVRAA